MKNTLEKAKAEMDGASKAAQAEAHSKSKSPTRTALGRTEATQSVPAAKSAETAKLAPQRPAGLFDTPTLAATSPVAPAALEDDPGFAEVDDDEAVELTEELDDAA
jgi:hypothetical protein